MTPIMLLDQLAGLGITIEAHEGGLRYAPRSAVTPELASAMKAHKPALIAILTAPDANALWQLACDQLAGQPDFTPEVIEALRTGAARWVTAETAAQDGPQSTIGGLPDTLCQGRPDA